MNDPQLERVYNLGVIDAETMEIQLCDSDDRDLSISFQSVQTKLRKLTFQEDQSVVVIPARPCADELLDKICSMGRIVDCYYV